MITITFHAKKRPQHTNLYNFQISFYATATRKMFAVGCTLPFINLLCWQGQDSRLKLNFLKICDVSVTERKETGKTPQPARLNSWDSHAAED